MRNATRYFVLFMRLSRVVKKERADRAAELKSKTSELRQQIEDMRSTNTRLTYELDQATHALRLANSNLRSADAETARVHTLNISLCRKLTQLEHGTTNPERLATVSQLLVEATTPPLRRVEE